MITATTPSASAPADYVDNGAGLEGASATVTSTWGAPSDTDGSTALNAVACPSSSWCVAVDASGHTLTYNNSKWSGTSTIDSTRSLQSVSCVSTSFCAAVDIGATPSLQRILVVVSPSNVVRPSMCPSRASHPFCVAVDG